MNDDLSPLAGFMGVARLFPLPNLVFFPRVVQPLHIFEPRYRQMTADALAGDRFIALVLPRPGWEADYEGRPPLYGVGTLGQIVGEEELEDGRYNLLLRGLSRIRITQELLPTEPYRKAKAELLVEAPVPSSALESRLRKALVKMSAPWIIAKKKSAEAFRELLESDMALGELCDVLAFVFPLEPDFKQELLEELDVAERARRLLDRLAKGKKMSKPSGPFPPGFSTN
jgi:Lon protease-like protein